MKYPRILAIGFVLLLNGALMATECVRAETLAEFDAKPAATEKKVYSVESVSIQSLIDGYLQFRQHYFDGDQLYKDLQKGQNPKALVIACSDSRCDPAIVTTAKPGDLFVIRNVANLIPPCESSEGGYHGTSAALEFGINVLGITNIIVLGHSRCAGIRSLFLPASTAKGPRSFVEKWMELANPAYQLVKEKYKGETVDIQAEHCARYAVINSLQNLRTFNWVSEREGAKKLSLHAWYFDIAEGKIYVYDQQTKVWSELASTTSLARTAIKVQK